MSGELPLLGELIVPELVDILLRVRLDQQPQMIVFLTFLIV